MRTHDNLDPRLEEYGRHLIISMYNYKATKERHAEGAKKDRAKRLHQQKRKKKVIFFIHQALQVECLEGKRKSHA